MKLISIISLLIVLLLVGCTAEEQTVMVQKETLPTQQQAPVTTVVQEKQPEPVKAPVVEKPVEEKIVPSLPPAVAPKPTPSTEEYTIEADDAGFYSSEGSKITELAVKKDTPTKLTIQVRSNGVYFGGLSFRSDKYDLNSGGVKPGAEKTMDFTAAANFKLSSYWYLSNRWKGDLSIKVE